MKLILYILGFMTGSTVCVLHCFSVNIDREITLY